MRVLIVEDERKLADAIATGLRREALAVDVAYDGYAGWELATVNDYDVIVLDRDLPGMHGDDVCAAVAASTAVTRILMLTAARSVGDRVDGLSLGADDYLAKPFAFKELVARVRALGRRTAPAVAPVLERGRLSVDPGRREVRVDGGVVSVSRKEFGLLEELLRAEGRAVTTEHLLEKVWDEHTDPFTSVVRVTMMTLRRKLGDATLIETFLAWAIASHEVVLGSNAADQASADSSVRRGVLARWRVDHSRDVLVGRRRTRNPTGARPW